MTQREFQEMMDSLTDEEIERLGIGSEKFNRRHKEIMDESDQILERERSKRQKRSEKH
ncbi:hypothetical protein AALC16_16735 [Lachnospiraceae bacterium 29-91]